jgi:hypothetical protein
VRVLRSYPPNHAAIVAAFPVIAHRRGILFCYADAIHNPDGITVTPALYAHEAVHSERQAGLFPNFGPEGWWNHYLANPQFRLAEELIAHRVEWRHFLGEGHGRKERRAYLSQLASRLASPLYGGLVTTAQAKRMIGAESQGAVGQDTAPA